MLITSVIDLPKQNQSTDFEASKTSMLGFKIVVFSQSSVESFSDNYNFTRWSHEKKTISPSNL